MTITTEYRGYEIKWSDNADEWVCYDAGEGVSGSSLLKVKEAIDRINLKARKDAAVPCIELHSSSRGIGKTESMIVQYIGPKIDRVGSYFEGYTQAITGHKVATVGKRRGNKKATRSVNELHKLMPDTPEAHAALAIADQLRKVAIEADAMADAAFKLIPRMQLSDVQRLVEITQTENGENDDAV